MPSTVKVRIHGARNLNLSYSDVYTTVSLGGHAGIISEYDDTNNDNNNSGSDHHHGSEHTATNPNYYKPRNHYKQNSKKKRKFYNARTRVSRKMNTSSSVKWEDDNEFRFEVFDDTLLQDEPLIFKVMESEGGSTSGGGGGSTGGGGGGTAGRRENGSIGLVYIDLNPLLMKSVIMSEEKDDEEKKKNEMKHDIVQMKIDEEEGGDRDGHSKMDMIFTSPKGGGDFQLRKQRTRSRSGSLGTPHDDKKDKVKRSSSGGSGSSGGVIDGWFPIYDPLEGVRGELGLSIKLNFIDNINPFRDSSAGVQLFPFSSFDEHSGYVVQHVFGFVEELVVAEDPEFEWNGGDGYNNNFRLARGSHEKRQTLMYLLDSSVRRRMCKKVLEMGGNAVLGYYQSFDMEGDSGIVARTYGTCVLIEKRRGQHGNYSFDASLRMKRRAIDGGRRDHLRDSSIFDDDDDVGSNITPVIGDRKGGSGEDVGNGSDEEASEGGKMIIKNKHLLSEAAAAAARHRESEQDEVQLLTIKEFGKRVRVRIGGLVTARSVKYLGKLASKLSDQETRDGWWQELRDEIRSHAKTLCCSHVIGYSEGSTIHDDVIILSLTGTAATVRGLPDLNKEQEIWMALERKISERNKKKWVGQQPGTGDSTPGGYLDTPYGAISDVELDESANGKLVGDQDVLNRRMSRKMLRREKHAQRLEKRYLKVIQGKNRSSFKDTKDVEPLVGSSIFRTRPARPCSYCHVPYHHKFAPFTNLKLCPCLLCGKKWVPEVILATVEPPERLPVRGPGVFIQARVCRTRSKSTGENDALAVSEALPFLEYEIARQLMLKLKVLGRNAAFSLKSEIDVGSQLIVGTLKSLTDLISILHL